MSVTVSITIKNTLTVPLTTNGVGPRFGPIVDATRSRLGLAADWLTAGTLLVGTVVVAALVVLELRTTSAVPSGANALERVGAADAAVPPEAVAVPALTLGTSEIKVGDSRSDALSRLTAFSPAPRVTRQTTERGPLGPREVRWYQLSGTSFILVFEAFERHGEPRVAAIYLV
jgi:hypothetical protein